MSDAVTGKQTATRAAAAKKTKYPSIDGYEIFFGALLMFIGFKYGLWDGKNTIGYFSKHIDDRSSVESAYSVVLFIGEVGSAMTAVSVADLFFRSRFGNNWIGRFLLGMIFIYVALNFCILGSRSTEIALQNDGVLPKLPLLLVLAGPFWFWQRRVAQQADIAQQPDMDIAGRGSRKTLIWLGGIALGLVLVPVLGEDWLSAKAALTVGLCNAAALVVIAVSKVDLYDYDRPDAIDPKVWALDVSGEYLYIEVYTDAGIVTKKVPYQQRLDNWLLAYSQLSQHKISAFFLALVSVVLSGFFSFMYQTPDRDSHEFIITSICMIMLFFSCVGSFRLSVLHDGLESIEEGPGPKPFFQQAPPSPPAAPSPPRGQPRYEV